MFLFNHPWVIGFLTGGLTRTLRYMLVPCIENMKFTACNQAQWLVLVIPATGDRD
jgi:hypothetical protein